MSDSKHILILNKIKNKAIIFEYIQGFALHRHYILPYLIENDNILQKKLTVLNNISKNNKLSSNLNNNLYTFLSDRMLYKIINKENIMNDNQYFDEIKEESFIKTYQDRITYIYKKCKYYYNYNTSNIKNDILEQFLPNDEDYAKFILDFLSLEKMQKKYDINFLKDKIVNSSEQKNMNKEDIYLYQKIPNINLVFIGNTQSGKSTTIGHLLYESGYIDNNTFEKIKEYSKRCYSYHHRYAWIMDNNYHERTENHTINTSSVKLETGKYNFSLIDIPGRLELINDAVKGIFQGDVAVIIVPVNEKSTKELFAEGDSLQDHIIHAYTMGIKQLIVAINKIDICNYSEKIYLEIKQKMEKFLIQIGFDKNDIQYICYSGITGQNLVNRYENDVKIKNNKTPWYKGYTLLEAFEKLKKPLRLINAPLRISTMKYQKITGVGWICYSIIKTGLLKKNDEIEFSLNENIFRGRCLSIEKYNKDLDVAIPGDIVGIQIKNIYLVNRLFYWKRSPLIIGNCGGDIPTKVVNFTSIIHVMNVPNSIKIGYAPTLFCHSVFVPVKFKEILFKLDGRTNKILEKNPKEIKNGERAVVLLEPLKFLLCEKYRDNPYYGSIIIRDNSKIKAVGKIIDVNNIKIEKKNVINLCDLKY